jgi:hypothetical protein
MKTLIDPKFQNEALEQWRGADAKLWMFHLTHNRMALVLSRPDEPDILYVIAVGCKHIAGPFSWRSADLRILVETQAESGDPSCRVIDRRAGFEIVCSSATLVRGPASDFATTFEDFLGDAPHPDVPRRSSGYQSANDETGPAA